MVTAPGRVTYIPVTCARKPAWLLLIKCLSLWRVETYDMIYCDVGLKCCVKVMVVPEYE